LKPAYYIGIMSGTSLDGIDAVLVDLGSSPPSLLHAFYLPYPEELRTRLQDLHYAGHDEIHRAALLGNELAEHYSEAVAGLLDGSGLERQDVAAIGCHGQTIRHNPLSGKGYTVQLCNSALLAELAGITVVGDFRSRDIAAGGQGAPLVPAFHQVLFQNSQIHRVIVNIGGISNLTSLPPDGKVIGFDCGPGNVMMDEWCRRHTDKAYDENGAWAQTGKKIPMLLERLLSLPFFSLAPPKSAGREIFNLAWLEGYLNGDEKPVDVQSTLLYLSIFAIADSVLRYCPDAGEVYLCGGGVHNLALLAGLQTALPGKKVESTERLGVNPDWLEAFAFAWLARQAVEGMPGNIPAVTGARGSRTLGAIYRA
jgi:anhydro-N-acetylmuramic acid kinase